MDKEQIPDWVLLQKSAHAAMQAGSVPPPGMQRALQLLFKPSFTDIFSVELFETPTLPPTFLLVRNRWNREADWDKVRTPVERLKYPPQLAPTIESTSQTPPPEFVAELWEKLRAAPVPAWIPNGKFGLDGTAYALKFGNHRWGIHYMWWESPPAAWAVLGEVAHAILNYAGIGPEPRADGFTGPGRTI